MLRAGKFEEARRLHDSAERELLGLGFGGFAALGERRAAEEFQELVQRSAVKEGRSSPSSTGGRAAASAAADASGRRIRVIGGPMVVEEGTRLIDVPTGNPQRLVGVIVAHGGVATFDQLAEAMWAGDDVDTSRSRLRNVLLRLRRGAGDLVARSGSGVRLAPGVGCDLYDFEQLATDALASARTDPEVAGHLAERRRAALAEGAVLADFEYEEWALAARRAVDHQLIGLLDLLSVQAEDAGDLALRSGACRAGAAPRPLHRLAVRPPRRAAHPPGPQRRCGRRSRGCRRSGA